QKTVSHYMIQAKARSLAATSSYQNQFHGIENYKFSQKYVDGFMSRHNLVNRRRTTTVQHLPETYNEEQSKFLSLILYKHDLIFDFSRIDNQMNPGREIEDQAETASDNKEGD
ncbi:30222_t:CDS:2, partial [Racocetra persica]